MLRLLSEVEDSGGYGRTICLTPESLVSWRQRGCAQDVAPEAAGLRDTLDAVGASETGALVFLGDRQAVGIAPPFPLAADRVSEGVDAAPLRELLSRDLLVGVALLRLGRYAVGVLEGERLASSKTASRYVKNRHRAGGSSQRRFERSRERLVRELYDKACAVTAEVFSRHGERIDYVLLGGERHTLRAFVQRCPYLQRYEGKTLARILHVDTPNRDALERIAFEVWKSRVAILTEGGGRD